MHCAIAALVGNISIGSEIIGYKITMSYQVNILRSLKK
jgi:hypothetical protein